MLRTGLPALLAGLAAAAWPAALHAQGLAEGMVLSPSMDPGRTIPLWQLLPFDRFQLKDDAKTWIDFEPARLPEDFDATAMKPWDSVQQLGLPSTLVYRKDIWYRFRAICDSGRYEVRGEGILTIETYEECIYKEMMKELAKDTMPEKVKFDDCLEYLRILRERDAQLNLKKTAKIRDLAKFARVRLRAAEAAAAISKSEYQRAFEWLEDERRARLLIPADVKLPSEVESLRPLVERVERLVDDWMRVTMGANRYDEGRRIIARLEASHANTRTADKWRREYDKLVKAVVERARQNVAAGFVPKAYDLLDEAVLIQPDHPEVRAEFRQLAASHPRLRVAVAELAAFRQGPAAWTPADHRAAALLHEPMTRLAGYKPDGAAIFSSRLLARIDDEGNLNRKVSIEVKPELQWPGDGKRVTPIDVQRQFANARDPAAALHHPALELLLNNVQSRPPAAALLEFDRPQFQSRMWLQTPLFRLSTDPTANNSVSGLGWQGLGPFRAYDRSLRRVQFVGNPRFLTPGEPVFKQLNEVRYAKPEDRFRALEYGDVDLVEFVPWRYATQAAKVPSARIVREATPKVHLLQFNFGRELLRDNKIRRAVALAIDRPAIFKAVQVEMGKEDALLANAAPIGALGNSDPSAEQWPYDPNMAKLWVAAAKKELNLSSALLTLSHQGNESTRVAVEEIAKQLRAAGFEINIVQVDDRNPDPRTADLRYQVAAPTEAVFDLVTLLSRDNPTLFAYASPQMRTLLVSLLQVSSSSKAFELIPEIHRAVHGDVALVPLWQWHDQFLVSETVEGVPAKPRFVYDGVSGWKTEPRFPPSWWENRGAAANAAAGANP